MSEFDPVEGSVGGKRQLDDRFPPEAAHLPSLPNVSKKPDREGLPSGYRMRADAHYVDQLTTRRTDRAGDGPRAASAADVREPGRDTMKDLAVEAYGFRSDRLLQHVAQDAVALESAALMLAGDTSPLARRVSVDLIRAQALRSAWLARACAVLAGGHRSQIRVHPVGTILSDIQDRFAAECRLSGVRLEAQASDWGSASCDRSALVTAIGAGIFATLALAGEVEGLQLRVTLVAADGEVQQVDVSQDDVTLGGAVVDRFFDPTWTDRPGGWLTDVAAATFRAVAERFGGQARLITGERRGTTMRLTFGRA